ncbi:hypothetical protein [Thiolapillus brandeum]|uniref:DUF4398 domain-containing protein n=1 Tax=Thiolapillus brandeum TaxID=1076588 RepID=A0A7U6GIE3_9GAMM|nr:hypothetical protein [Thiolapillus brandeum]BAO44158.1 hypothetical protein TBH_C1233 [Thiolapillus brandeum]
MSNAIRNKLTITATILLMGCSNLSTAEYQPAMEKALEALLVAERALENASHDKGGHRAAALRHVRAAIEDTRRGIRYDNRH